MSVTQRKSASSTGPRTPSYSFLGAINPTVMGFVFLFALSSAGALFLISELNSPFNGLLKLPKTQLSQALVPLSK